MDPLPTDAERADTLLSAINYALDELCCFEGMDWLRAWRDGDPDAMAALESWRKARGR